MSVNKEKYPDSYMTFQYIDCEGNNTTREVALDFGSTWHDAIYQVARTLEASGFSGVVDRIKVKNIEAEYDEEAKQYIPLKESLSDERW